MTEEGRSQLENMNRARKAPLREIHRSQILLHYAQGRTIMEISSLLKIGRPAIYKCVDKALAAGVETALKDKYHKAKEPSITEEAKIYVINLACTKPTEHGYAAEIWSLSSLAHHARRARSSAGHTCLENAAKATIQRIFKAKICSHTRYATILKSVILSLSQRCGKSSQSTRKSPSTNRATIKSPYQWMKSPAFRVYGISLPTCRQKPGSILR